MPDLKLHPPNDFGAVAALQTLEAVIPMVIATDSLPLSFSDVSLEISFSSELPTHALRSKAVGPTLCPWLIHVMRPARVHLHAPRVKFTRPWRGPRYRV